MKVLCPVFWKGGAALKWKLDIKKVCSIKKNKRKEEEEKKPV